MKDYTIPLLIAIGCGLLAGCVHSVNPSVSQIDSTPSISASVSNGGTLVVYSAWDVYRLGSQLHPRHTNYDIYSADNKLIQHVMNNIMPVLADPVSVPMASGSYVVKAKSAGGGTVTVPVVINQGKTTVVRMD